jgi:hypothetical protein
MLPNSWTNSPKTEAKITVTSGLPRSRFLPVAIRYYSRGCKARNRALLFFVTRDELGVGHGIIRVQVTLVAPGYSSRSIPHHTVPYGTEPLLYGSPGSSCLATIVQSFRDARSLQTDSTHSHTNKTKSCFLRCPGSCLPRASGRKSRPDPK